jgi:hypothetical protein
MEKMEGYFLVVSAVKLIVEQKKISLQSNYLRKNGLEAQELRNVGVLFY